MESLSRAREHVLSNARLEIYWMLRFISDMSNHESNSNLKLWELLQVIKIYQFSLCPIMESGPTSCTSKMGSWMQDICKHKSSQCYEGYEMPSYGGTTVALINCNTL
jgi:hypothetical protein